MLKDISRREFVGWSLAGAASLALAACGFGSSSGTAVKKSLSVGMKATLKELTPIGLQGYQWIQMMSHAMYDGLIRNDSQGKAQPHVALSWDETSPTATVIKVRQGIKFNSGDPLTAKDVAYSIAVRSDPALVAKTSSRPVMTGKQWVSSEVLDTYTVRINTTERSGFLINPAPVMVVPENAFDKYNLSTTDVGSGPFQLVKFTSGTSLQVKANPNYWGGAPKFDTMTFQFFADVASEALNLRSGQVDALYDVSPLHLKDVNGIAHKKTFADATYMDWWVAQIGKPPLNNPDVRKALRYCFNRPLLNQSSFSGAGKDTWNPFDFTPYKSGAEVTGVTYDPEKAKSMLAAAGASNITVPLLGIDSYEDSIIQGQIIQQGLQAAGVKTSFSSPPISDWIKATYGDATWEGLFFNAGNLPFPNSNLFDFMVDPAGLKSAYTPGGGSPLPRIAALYAQVQGATAAQLPSLLNQVQDSIVNDCIAYFMFGGPVSIVAPDNLNGVVTNGGGDVFWEKAYLS
jgi:peptide/nickel transport system substrate-binding protein